MVPIVYDFETYWSVTHSLTKMSAISYVMHPDTEIQSVAIKVGNSPTVVIFGEEAIRAYLFSINWNDALAIAHNNSEFDAMLLAWRFGINPKMWGCTLAMARPIFAKDVGGSLKAVMKALGCPFEKGSLEEVNTKGKRLAEFTPDEIAKMTEYNKIDTEGCSWIFRQLARRTPLHELQVIDATIRMLVEPEFECDTELLRSTLVEEKNRKLKTLIDVATITGAYLPGMTDDEAAEASRKMLASGPKFAQFMRDLGYEPPMKPSPSNPEKRTYALAKTDQAFLDLQDHVDPLVSAAASARLGVKSTILETRIEKFLETAAYCGGKLPMPLKYYGADTTGRWSGFLFNPQNLPRINPKEHKASDALRKCMRAPKGKKVVVADLSGIELRVNMFLWKVPYAMELFKNDPANADLYRYFAAHELYNIAEEAVSKIQRQVGKVSHLGLGFGAGAETFQGVAKLMGGVNMSLDESKEVVLKYRKAHPEIPQGWKTCHSALDYIKAGSEFPIDPWGMCVTCAEGIKTPRGIIRYPDLRQEQVMKDDQPTGKFEWVYGHGSKKARIYAGKITENIVQHLARNVIVDMMLDVYKSTGLMPKLTVHDELIYIVDEDKADAMLATVQGVMRRGVAWWPELVTWSEGDIADTYGEAK